MVVYRHYGGVNMAVRGVAIKDVNNILQSEDITGNEKLPVSASQENVPRVITTEELKEYINDGMQQILISGDNIKTVNNESLLGGGNLTVVGGNAIPLTVEEINSICI